MELLIDKDLLSEQLDRAAIAGKLAQTIEPRAKSAYYDAVTGMIVIHLQSGAIFMFPHELGQGLVGASVEELAEIEVIESGFGLHWETLDADLTVPGLLAGRFGTQAWMNKLWKKQQDKD